MFPHQMTNFFVQSPHFDKETKDNLPHLSDSGLLHFNDDYGMSCTIS